MFKDEIIAERGPLKTKGLHFFVETSRLKKFIRKNAHRSIPTCVIIISLRLTR
ncbi:hypothetical protein CDL15_Pgr000347 [Punica granatum]|uniref:Uncharacterized protein n=1 Tax=Punica granatum TaxID=22663 RepID=A0A218XSY1_PUNGR|nr:hypothetical protein CDL15_Pgr000347 [Punica granatum]